LEPTGKVYEWSKEYEDDNGILRDKINGEMSQNSGNDEINVTANVTSALPTGVVLTAMQAQTDYETVCSASNLPDTGKCVNITNDAGKRIAANIAAAATEEIWWKANFVSADLGGGAGVAGSASRTMRTNAFASTG